MIFLCRARETANVMVETLRLPGYTLEEVGIESYSMLPPLYHLCSSVLRWGNGEILREQRLPMRPGDVLALALLMKAPLFVADEISHQIGVTLAEGERDSSHY